MMIVYREGYVMIGVGLVGFGYWGPNLARNFSIQPDCRLLAICETDESNAARAARLYPYARVTPYYREILDNQDIQAVLIATPVSTHFDLVKDALLSGKDVLVEKPLAESVAKAKELVLLAKKE